MAGHAAKYDEFESRPMTYLVLILILKTFR